MDLRTSTQQESSVEHPQEIVMNINEEQETITEIEFEKSPSGKPECTLVLSDESPDKSLKEESGTSAVSNSFEALPVENTDTFDEVRYRHLTDFLNTIRSATVEETSSLLTEGARQYQASTVSVVTLWKTVKKDLHSGIHSVQTFLTQPVWIIRPRHAPKRYSRWTLFMIDTVRFGGTFTALFLALFVALNYQSFWEIVSAHLNPMAQLFSMSEPNGNQNTLLREALLKSPALTVAGPSAGDLLSFLPPVGPPDNRLIVPKLNLNVPIVAPSIDALLREDWAQVETDIQQSLQEGVVHYPGTANPGQAGNFFLTGHSSYYPWATGKYKTVFSRLQELSAGDEYWVYYNGDKHRYTVLDKQEVKPSNVDVLTQPLNRRLGTLMTCTPVGTTLRRLIISSEEVDPETGKPLAVGEQPERERPDIKVEMLPI